MEFPEPSTESLKRNLHVAARVIEGICRMTGVNIETAEMEMSVGDAIVRLPIGKEVEKWKALSK